MDQRFVSDRFPRSSAYHPDWIMASVSGGANSLWLTEWLTEAMNLPAGMRVLDLGCGRGASSIFLRREFDVQVWAVDLWNSVSGRFQRVRDAGVEDGVFPIHADVPFAVEFFDAIVCIDAFPYCGGTDDLYLHYLARFVKPGGLLGIAGAGVLLDVVGAGVPEHLRSWWTQDQGWCLHSATWWRRHWEQSGIVDIEVADTMPDGWQRWLDWHRAIAPDNREEIQTLETDQGRYLGYVRLVGRRRMDAQLRDPIGSVPVEYKKTPLLHGST